MKNWVAFFILLMPFSTFAQGMIRGRVINEKNNPVPGASIFLSNTSIGTRADDEGRFQLNLPAGKFDLVVSSVGYQTYTNAVEANTIKDLITIILIEKTQELEAVVIEPYEKNGWEKWGLFFTENFIGTSSNALRTKIKNKEAIRFRHSKKDNRITAIATEPLVIENKALGYTITLQLEHFSYSFSNRYMIYIGYALFEEMKGGSSKKRKWEKARSEAYYGSMMHFMRSLYRNNILDDGFEVRRLKKFPNTEKQRIKALYASHARRITGETKIHLSSPRDSVEYYDRIMAQDDEINVIGKDVLPGDSIAYGLDSTTAAIDFDNYLLIIYKHKLAPLEYQQQYPKSSTSMMSQITLVNKTPVHIEASGNYYDPSELLSSGFWAWSEKIAMMLPFDYRPSSPPEKN